MQPGPVHLAVHPADQDPVPVAREDGQRLKSRAVREGQGVLGEPLAERLDVPRVGRRLDGEGEVVALMRHDRSWKVLT